MYFMSATSLARGTRLPVEYVTWCALGSSEATAKYDSDCGDVIKVDRALVTAIYSHLATSNSSRLIVHTWGEVVNSKSLKLRRCLNTPSQQQ